MSEVLLLSDVKRTYRQGGRELHVLSGLNLAISKGEMAALVGPSGCGKTTLLQVAGLLDNPDGGSVKLLGEEMARAADAQRTRARRDNIGFVYQFHHLLPEFSARENVMMPLLIAGRDKAQAGARADELLAAMGLAERGGHRPSQLSGGEQQRVAIARAVVHKPALLLADEPTGNLDPQTAEEVFQFFVKLVRQEGVAALMATHNLELAGRMNRTLKLQNGNITG